MVVRQCETHGRKLLVEFKCYRCETTVIRPLEECMKEASNYYRDLYDFKPPNGWKDGGFSSHMLCPKCAKAYEDFMNNKGGAEGRTEE